MMASKKELAARMSKLEEILKWIADDLKDLDPVAKIEKQEKDIADLKRSISDIWRVIRLTNENVDGLIQANGKTKPKQDGE